MACFVVSAVVDTVTYSQLVSVTILSNIFEIVFVKAKSFNSGQVFNFLPNRLNLRAIIIWLVVVSRIFSRILRSCHCAFQELHELSMLRRSLNRVQVFPRVDGVFHTAPLGSILSCDNLPIECDLAKRRQTS